MVDLLNRVVLSANAVDRMRILMHPENYWIFKNSSIADSTLSDSAHSVTGLFNLHVGGSGSSVGIYWVGKIVNWSYSS